MATDYVTRNIGIMAHIDAGKTTLTERLLYYSGKTHKIGEVHARNAVMDTTPEEMEKKITIKSAATSIHWSGASITVIDTPGHVDFFIEVERSLRVLDGAVALFCAKGAVEAQSETIWRQANKYNVPRIAFINKMDIEGADFYNVIYEIKKKLLAKPVPVMLPIGKGKEFLGIIDILKNKAYYYDMEETILTDKDGDVRKINYEERDVPSEYAEEVMQYKKDLVLAIAEEDEELFEAYCSLDEDVNAIDVDLIKKCLRKATQDLRLVPVFCGSAYKNKGAQQLLDGVIDYLPSPQDRGAITGINPNTNEKEIRMPTEDAPFSAIAFNIGQIGAGQNDDNKQRGVYIRVYSGSIDRKNRRIYNANKNVMEAVNKICTMHANKPTEVQTLKAGEIGVLVGLSDNTVTGNTLCDKESPIVFGAMTFPEPVVKMSIEPKTKAGNEQMWKAFAKLQLEDPTFKVYNDVKTGQTIIAAMGELYLDVIVKRLRREFKVEATVGQPQVSYKEKLKDDVVIEGKCQRAMGIKPNVKQQFALVKVAFELLPEGSESTYVVDVPPEVLPTNYAEAALKGIEGAAMGGLLGFGLVEMRARIIGGEYHSSESSELAFSYAGQLAMQEAMNMVGAVLLEPIMRVEIEFPADNPKFNSSVISLVNKHRGNVVDTVERAGLKVIFAEIPLKEMLGISGFSVELRGVTQSRGFYSMELKGYAVCTDKDVGGIY